ncbi:MAG: hypothetical protein ABIM74_00185 [candidate division WOR-3 bacterium]
MRGWLLWLYAGLAVMFAVIFTRIRFSGFPEASVSLFAAASMRSPYPFSLILGIVLGLLTEGLHPSEPWVTPLLYILLASASRYARDQMNLRGWLLGLYFLFWGIAFRVLPPIFHGQTAGFLDAAVGSALTAVLAYLLYLPWKEE